MQISPAFLTLYFPISEEAMVGGMNLEHLSSVVYPQRWALDKRRMPSDYFINLMYMYGTGI